MGALKGRVKNLILLLIILSVSFFFYKSFQANWASIRQFKLQINLAFISLSFVFVLSNYLLMTFSWYATINHLSGDNKITYLQSVGAVNTSNLTKYLPGKIWSFALQMYWLDKAGYRKALVLYVNLTNLFIGLMTSMILGLVLLTSFSPLHANVIANCALLALIAADVMYILFTAQFSRLIIFCFNKIFGKDIEYYKISIPCIIRIHILNLLAAFLFGLGAYFLCLGIGFDVSIGKIFPIMASLILSDTIGFLALVVPGGLGVRESIMYLILNGSSPESLALILPLATRIISMSVDVLLGIFGYLLLRRFMAAKNESDV